MQRVSLSDHWVIPKRFLRLEFAKLSSVIFIIGCLSTAWIGAARGTAVEGLKDSVSHNPQYIATFNLAILGLILRYIIRSPGQQRQAPHLDLYQTAYLAGGAARAVELAITQLVYQGYLRPHAHNRTFTLRKQISAEASPLEQQVMQQVQRTPAIKDLKSVRKYETSFIRKSLERERLLMKGWTAFMGVSLGLLINVIVFSVIFTAVAIPILGPLFSDTLGALFSYALGDRFPDMNCFGFAFKAIGIISLCCFTPRLHTRLGSQVLAGIRNKHDTYDAMQRFALYGCETLSGGELDDLRQILKRECEEADAGACGCGC